VSKVKSIAARLMKALPGRTSEIGDEGRQNLKSEIRNIRLDKAFVRFDISDFGFEILLPKSGYFGFATK
jgi:hypothetical protein